MSDAERPDGVDEPMTPEMADVQLDETEGLLIIAGGIADPDSDEAEESVHIDAVIEDEADESSSNFTLDELVAEMAGVSAVSVDSFAGEAVPAPAPDYVDPLVAAMSDAFAEAGPVEDAMWTRAPFWATGAIWAVFVGVLTFLLWSKSTSGLQEAPLYGVLVYGGAALVIIGLAGGFFVWSRARAVADVTDRAIVSRAVLLRVLGWTAIGVALWVVAMIVLSLRYLDVF